MYSNTNQILIFFQHGSKVGGIVRPHDGKCHLENKDPPIYYNLYDYYVSFMHLATSVCVIHCSWFVYCHHYII